MKGVVVENVGGPYKVVDDLEKPKPGANQILVKSLYAAINPVYGICPADKTEEKSHKSNTKG